MISASCPTCKILVVEATNDLTASLAKTEWTAARLGAQVISNSYGQRENGFAMAYRHAYHQPGHTIVVARSDQHGGSSGSFKAGETAIARFAIPSWLTPSRYLLTPSVAREGTGENALALVEDMTSIVVHGSSSGGILELPVDVKIERA